MKNEIVIAVTIENEMGDQFELNIGGATVFVSRENLFNAIELGFDPEGDYDRGINTEATYADLGGEEM